MAITPNTQIRLLKLPFEIDNKNQLTFANVQAQSQYFESLPAYEIEHCQYQRKDNIIYFPAHIDSIINYNYVMYKNNNYDDKWFYAFITNMEYNNDGLTNITIKTDVFQTWQFDIIYKRMFVEREHVSDDTIGLHTIDENLNIGDVIQEGQVEETSLSEYYYVAVETDWIPDENSHSGGKQSSGISVYNKTIFGHKILLFTANFLTSFTNLAFYLIRTNADGHIDDVKNMFIVPQAVVNNKNLTSHTAYADSGNDHQFTWYEMDYNLDINKIDININKPSNFSDYTPKNNKCFAYPYNYLLVSNNVGNEKIYKYEDFYGTNIASFEIASILSIGCSGKLIPKNYKKINNNYDEGLPLAKYPICAWSSDTFTNWLTQQSVNISTNLAMGLMSSVIEASSGNAVQSGMSIAQTIGNTIGGFYSAELMPNIEGGENTGDLTWAYNKNTFVFRAMRVKTEYLKIIDDYFSMYGYKVNEVKIPNITGRSNWNYVKTIEANIIGNIPQEDLQELKNIFDNGVTFWHNPNTFLDYSQSNSL